MSISHDPDGSHDSESTSGSMRRMLLGCVCVPVGFIVLLFLCGWLWYRSEIARAEKLLEVEKQYVKDRGDPLTASELNAAYLAEQSREDITAELLKALSDAHSPQLQALARSLPIVGSATPADVPLPDEEWVQLAEAEAYLAQQKPLLDLLATLPNRQWTVRFPAALNQGMSTKLDHANLVRNACRIQSLQWHVDIHRQRPDEAVQRIFEMFELADSLKREPTLLSQLVRSAVHALAVTHIEKTLQHADVSDDDLIRLQQALRRYDARQTWNTALQGERAFFYSLSAVPLTNLNLESLSPQEMEKFADRKPIRPHDALFGLRLFREMQVANDESMRESVVAAEKTDQQLKAMVGSTTERLKHIQTSLTMPSLGAGTEGIARNGARAQAADAALAALRFRRINQVWPQELARLVPEFLPAVPIDPFDGQPLRVVITDQDFKVYSIGRDRIDNGGDLGDPKVLDAGFNATWRTSK